MDVLSKVAPEKQSHIFDESFPGLTKQKIKKKLLNITGDKLEILANADIESKEGIRFSNFLKL